MFQIFRLNMLNLYVIYARCHYALLKKREIGKALVILSTKMAETIFAGFLLDPKYFLLKNSLSQPVASLHYLETFWGSNCRYLLSRDSFICCIPTPGSQGLGRLLASCEWSLGAPDMMSPCTHSVPVPPFSSAHHTFPCGHREVVSAPWSWHLFPWPLRTHAAAEFSGIELCSAATWTCCWQTLIKCPFRDRAIRMWLVFVVCVCDTFFMLPHLNR